MKIKIEKIKKKLDNKDHDMKNNKYEYESKLKSLNKENDNLNEQLDIMKNKLSETIQHKVKTETGNLKKNLSEIKEKLIIKENETAK